MNRRPCRVQGVHGNQHTGANDEPNSNGSSRYPGRTAPYAPSVGSYRLPSLYCSRRYRSFSSIGTADELRGLIKALTASGAILSEGPAVEIENLSKRLSKASAA